ncbi:cysteine desulfurase CsdA [Stutzerimonas nosocomialis]|uniref:cysteine desulfurase n=1 Tax=Stutzerimonas nosocomialis TaxID=1056496 RepID=A0A5R9QYI3_9GAMM|nr:aminotransferase class V-fold PLP-dependent enzyme [Stutzerimonas nosocomialis]TLX63925.1 cysteine desulfurase CsdA [Stutzerimonas nosocomialis]
MALTSPWRADFPAISVLEAEGQTYLDSAATAQKPQALMDRVYGYFRSGAANVHRAQHLPSERATRAFEATRETTARWLNARADDEIVFTHGATEAFNLLAYGLEAQFRSGDEIVISTLEHHANLLPWQQLARRKGLRLVVLPIDAEGRVDLQVASGLIGPRTRLLAISQLSNVLGTWQPLTELLELARRVGAITVVDGAQGIVHGRHDVQALGCDFYVFSSHKLYGPEGLGVLYGRRDRLLTLRHWQFGGEMVRHARLDDAYFHAPPMGLEAGTPAIGAVIGLGATLGYLGGLDAEAVHRHERALLDRLCQGLRQRAGVRLLGEPQAALASFVVEGVHNADLASLLGEQGIAVRAGQHCAMPLYQSLELGGAIRVSLALYNDGSDLDRFFAALDAALEILR